jgi:glycosyltransferase involved in cell wall biosynthesis
MPERTVLYVNITSGVGGAAQSLLTLIRYARERGIRPILAGQQEREGMWEVAEAEGIPFYPLYLTSWAKSDLSLQDILYIPNRINTIRRMRNICRRESVDLIHSNLPYALEGALTARVTGLSHVFHVRDEFLTTYRTWWGGPGGAARFMHRMSDRVIAVSTNIAEEFDRIGAEDTVRIIPNPVDIPPLDSELDTNEVRLTYGLPTGRPVIGTFGSIAQWKGQLDLVHAIDRLRSANESAVAVIVGAGVGDEYEGQVRDEVNRLDLSDHVFFTGHLQDIWPLMRSVDIVAVPSHAEGFGRVVVEGMGAGKPVVASATGGIVDIIQDGENGLLTPPGDALTLAETLARALHDPKLRSRLATAGKRRAAKVYTPEAHVEQVLGVYEELLGPL